MKALHLTRTLPGMVNSMQVKPANSEGKAEERKLFVGMIPKSYDEDDLTPMFTPFGTIEELNILKSADGKSKG
jgi:CUG-BP- and ETR3-like factor